MGHVMSTQWHNPENVSADLLPKGYRFLTEEEFDKDMGGWRKQGLARLWFGAGGSLSDPGTKGWGFPGVMVGDCEYTYCVPIAAMPAVGSYGRAYQQPYTTLRDKLIAGGTDLESVDAVLRNGDMSAEPDKVLIDAKELAELRADKARLDWLTAKGPWDQWMHVETKEQLTLRGDVRDAIDAARKEAAK